ncbi:B-cell receptor-associated protein 29-like [Polyodon spathula]|uniref:B-cell receptor-associated protein 29-like n=1 Tax=Polyodon spathula TaxID=7913 RepID=UPI001B7DA331|nr:B-cell receptor-associated protein 29-like [Polyodon spathula]
MTLQWTVVATFLYIEIGLLLILCLPFISAQRWQKIFKFRIWARVVPYWNRGFLTMIVVLIVLFLDAVREVRKYSGTDANKDAKLHANMFDHLYMKLFRSQRNLYISGFSLFLWFILRRVVTVITQLTTAQGVSDALQTQAENTNEAASKYMEDNERLKSQSTLTKSKNEVEAVKKQSDGLAREYDRLLQEHEKIQNLAEVNNDKKDH